MTTWTGSGTKADHLAAYVIEVLGRVETMKLQKLLYYCNGWSLGLVGQRIFEEPIEAWKHGPVIPHIYKQHRLKASVDSWLSGDPNKLDATDRAVAKAVIESYGAKSGWALREQSHRETPWLDAWKRANYGAIHHVEITTDAMDSFFTAEARRGQDQRRAESMGSEPANSYK